MTSKDGAWRYTVPIPGRRRTKTYYVCEVGHEHRTERAALRCSAKALVAIHREIDAGKEETNGTDD